MAELVKEITGIMEANQTPRAELVFSGIQPSGAQVHIGNYLGAMKRFVALSAKHETIFCIVDLHALTSVGKKEELEEYSISLAAAYLAIGLDPERTTLFRQSDVPEVCELMWYLCCQFPLGLLERSHALKDKRAKNESVNSGLMFYPVLMAADILLPRATLVPVGQDQKQHVEMSREIAIKCNHLFGEIFPVPEPLIESETGVIPGIDGRKMSKSYNNYIGLFEDPKTLKSKVMKIVTDSKSVDEPKDPTTCTVYKLYQLLATPDEASELASRYRVGGLGYGTAKQELLSVIERELAPLRERYEALRARPNYLHEVLGDGAAKHRKLATETIRMVRDAQGLGRYL